MQAVQAGCDQLLMPGDPGVAYHALLRAVRHGRISLAQLDASVARIVSLKLARGLLSEPAASPSAAADAANPSRQRNLARPRPCSQSWRPPAGGSSRAGPRPT